MPIASIVGCCESRELRSDWIEGLLFVMEPVPDTINREKKTKLNLS